MARKASTRKGSSRAKSSKKAAAPKKSKAGGAATAASYGRDVLKRLLSAIAEALTRKPAKSSKTNPIPARKNVSGTAKASRQPRREADIPMDRIAAQYTPTQTSLKGPFRPSGAPRQRDQEYSRGVDDNDWKDEDRFTNKSGDPRIGTHGRTYEPGEQRVASSSEEEE